MLATRVLPIKHAEYNNNHRPLACVAGANTISKATEQSQGFSAITDSSLETLVKNKYFMVWISIQNTVCFSPAPQKFYSLYAIAIR